MSSLSQDNRFEYKYIITEPTARSVRDFVACYLERDKYADPSRRNSYAVHSLYLDSRGLALCRATLQGHKNRFKLRLRFYDEVREHPVFFEVKRRLNDVILKQRAAVRREAILPLLAGHAPSPQDLMDPLGGDFGALEHFCRLRGVVEADGLAFVSYLREAYATPDERIRVTFDRVIRGAEYHHRFELPPDPQWHYPPIAGVVLELKFTDRFPRWMREMVQSLDLWRGNMAKYVTSVTTAPSPMLSFLAYEL